MTTKKQTQLPQSVRDALSKHNLLTADVTLEDVLPALCDAYIMLRDMQRARINTAKRITKETDELCAALAFLADCCGKRESVYDLTGSDGLKLNMSGVLQKVAERVRSLTADARGVVNGNQSHLTRDPLDGLWQTQDGGR